jgi:hypothetical protein
VNDVFVFCSNGRTTTNVVYMKLLWWSFFSISCLFLSFDGLKFHALDAKMVATKATFTTCSCWKQNAS